MELLDLCTFRLDAANAYGLARLAPGVPLPPSWSGGRYRLFQWAALPALIAEPESACGSPTLQPAGRERPSARRL